MHALLEVRLHSNWRFVMNLVGRFHHGRGSRQTGHSASREPYSFSIVFLITPVDITGLPVLHWTELSGATLNPDGWDFSQDSMSEPLDNPISEPEQDSVTADPSAFENEPSGMLPVVFKGRMFCVVHGRQCYRARTLIGQNVWVCPDERHSKPLAG